MKFMRCAAVFSFAALSGFGGLISSAQADTAAAQVVTQAPDAAYSVYKAREDGSLSRQPMVMKDYTDLAKPGAKAPPVPAGLPLGKKWDWQYSGVYFQVSTPQKFLQQGQVVKLANGDIATCYKADGTVEFLSHSKYTLSGTANNVTISPDPANFTVKNGTVTSVTISTNAVVGP